MSESVAVIVFIELADDHALDALGATRLDPPAGLLDELWGEDIGDAPPPKNVTAALRALARDLTSKAHGGTLELSGAMPLDVFRERARTMAALAWTAHCAGARGALEIAGDGIAIGGRVDIERWTVLAVPPGDVFERIAGPRATCSAGAEDDRTEGARTAEAAMVSLARGAASDADLEVLFEVITPPRNPLAYLPLSPSVRSAVVGLCAHRDPRIVKLANARVPKTIDRQHGPRAMFIADLVRVLAAQGGAAAIAKIESIRARAAPERRRPPGLVHATCDELLGSVLRGEGHS